jgi:cytidine deaminase
VVTETEAPTPPCGACRQVLQEFAPDLRIYLAGRGDGVEACGLRDLLPHPFDSFDTGGER